MELVRCREELCAEAHVAERRRREAEEQERAQQQAREQAERERIARDEEEREARATEQRLQREVARIHTLEEEIDNLKRALEIDLACLPPDRRAHFAATLALAVDKPSRKEPECVVCRDRKVERAIIPCGHHCLCDQCAAAFAWNSQCPLCRGHVQSTLKIFNQH